MAARCRLLAMLPPLGKCPGRLSPGSPMVDCPVCGGSFGCCPNPNPTGSICPFDRSVDIVGEGVNVAKPQEGKAQTNSHIPMMLPRGGGREGGSQAPGKARKVAAVADDDDGR